MVDYATDGFAVDYMVGYGSGSGRSGSRRKGDAGKGTPAEAQRETSGREC